MIAYSLYIMGYWMAMTLPLGLSYWVACRLADCFYWVSAKDRRTVIKNMKVIRPEIDDREAAQTARKVFRNFAKYLVDFFRFSKIDGEYIKRYIKTVGLERIDTVLAKGKGVVLLSAHIGNWELGGAVLSTMGYPLSAVVLTHTNKKINDFFTRQRRFGKMKPIEMGLALRECFRVLKDNGALALLGDRDFTKRGGILKDFFGNKVLIPTGPSVLSRKTGCAIIPCFMVRNDDDTFTFFVEPPMYTDATGDKKASVEKAMDEWVSMIETYVKRYPTQWYVFRNIWGEDERNLRPDTII